MTTYLETAKSALLNYPSLFSNKLAVNAHLFAVIGNGYEWSAEGSLEDQFTISRHTDVMWYGDLDEGFAEIKKYMEIDVSLYAQHQSRRMMRQFMAENIDIILDNTCAFTFFDEMGYSHKLHTYMKPNTVSYKYAKIFNYPANIQKDWAEGMEDFISVWLVGLNQEYGISTAKDLNEAVKHWPDNAKTLRTRLLHVQEDLLTKITGKDTATRRAETKILVDKIMADLNREC